jgi:hypothetical protein
MIYQRLLAEMAWTQVESLQESIKDWLAKYCTHLDKSTTLYIQHHMEVNSKSPF